MKTKILLSRALLVGGILTTIIGIAHIFMPTIGYDNSVPNSLTPVIRDHFYFLGTYAICTFLLSLGFISMYFSKLKHPQESLVICTILALLWIARTILEFIYPVDLKIFFLSSPHSMLLLVSVFLAIFYSIGSIKGWMMVSDN